MFLLVKLIIKKVCYSKRVCINDYFSFKKIDKNYLNKLISKRYVISNY